MENEIVEQLYEWAGPFITGAVALIFTLWLRDFAGKVVRSVSFKFSGQFKEGEEVIIDGERAIIVKIGLTQTVFGIYRTTKGSSKINHYWRFVPNERIPFLHVEKIVADHEDIEGNDK